MAGHVRGHVSHAAGAPQPGQTRAETTTSSSGPWTGSIYLGTDTQYLLRLDDGTEITVRAQNAHDCAPRCSSSTNGRPSRSTRVPARLLVD